MLWTLLLAHLGTAQAADGHIPVQGVLTDSAGLPIDGTREVSFTLFSDGGATQALWQETVTLDVVEGVFALELGTTVPLNLDVFANYPAVHLEIQVADDSPMDLVPLGHVPYAAWAEQAADADTLGGSSLADIQAEIPLRSEIETIARDTAYDTPAELTAELDSRYLQVASYAPSWTDLTGIPAGFADGVDDVLTQSTVEAYATGVAYDTPAELTAALSGSYVDATGGTADNLTTTGVLTTGAVRVTLDEDVGLNTTGSVLIGAGGGVNLALDANEIMARDNGAATTLFIQREGGQVTIGAELLVDSNSARIGGDLTLDGRVTCPSGWHRAGTVCISPRQSAAAYGATVPACTTNHGAHVCDLRDLMTCDSAAPAGADCTEDTDGPNTVWLADLPMNVDESVYNGGSAFAYRGSGPVNNSLVLRPKTELNAYYCCRYAP